MIKIISLIIVNILTFIRFIGVFYVYPIYKNYGGIAAAILSFFCYLTDLLDGIIARKCHASTFFGSVFDGLADKAFSCANLLILMAMTKFTIIPIIFEIGIIIIQTIRYHKNINVKSSDMGKTKTWVISITVILLYLITDIDNVPFISLTFINFIKSINQVHLIAIIFIPLYIFEFLTFMSYLNFLKTNEIMENNFSNNLNNTPITEFTDNNLNNFYTFWFSNEFYEKYKDSTGLKELKNKLRKKDNS